jgi:hypothetical protein
MAKKDNEEDMLEDYEADEEKPKKKKSKRGKKTKTLIWIAAFIVILAILLLIRFKYSGSEAPKTETPVEEQAPPEQVEEQYVPEPDRTSADESEANAGPEVSEGPQDLGEQVKPKEDFPNVQSNIDTTGVPQLFSDLTCEYDETSKLLYIGLHIYNTLGEDIKIAPHGVQKGYNTYFKIRGVVDTDPGCGTELLLPNEYTDCKRIGFDLPRYANMPGINRISVQVPGSTEALLIECPDVPEDSPIVQWIPK